MKAIKRISVLVLALVMVFMLCIPSDMAHADDTDVTTITFKDTIVYQEVVRNIIDSYSITTDDDKMQITMKKSDITSIKTLRLTIASYSSGSLMKDLSGLENFTGLTTLEITNSNSNNGQVKDGVYTDLSPLSGLTNLTWLELNGTHATNLNAIAGLTNLTYLQVEGAEELDISAIKDLSNLTELKLFTCGIDDDDFKYITENAPELTKLYIGYANYEGNNVSDISSISKLSKLKVLRLDNNKIENIEPLSQLTGLTSLAIRCNPVKDISALETLTNLQYLYLGRDGFEGDKEGVPINGNIDVLGKIPKLIWLEASHCGITDIKALEPIMANLYKLDLTSNSITDYSLVEKEFKGNSLELGDQLYEYAADSGETIKLPQVLLDAMYDEDSFVYTDNLTKNGLKLTNCTLSDDGKSIIINKNVTSAQVSAGYRSNGYKYSARIQYNVTDVNNPEVEVQYSTTESTNKDVTVTLIVDEDVQPIDGFNKVIYSGNKYQKTYTDNTKESIDVYDLSGNKTTVEVNVNNIDRVDPEVKVSYSTKELTNKDVEVTLTANEDIQEIEGFTKVDNRTYKKTYKENFGEDVTVFDIAGNYNVVKVKVANIDKISPEVTVSYSTKETTYDPVEVTLTADEDVQAIEGFTKVDSRTYKKTFAKNTDTNVDVYDLAGNKTVVNISITNINEKPVTPVTPTEPVVPEEPTTPAAPTEPAVPEKPTTPVTPTEPATAEQPTTSEVPSAEEEPVVAPDTGDNSMAAMYAIIAGITGAAVLLSAKKKKYNR